MTEFLVMLLLSAGIRGLCPESGFSRHARDWAQDFVRVRQALCQPHHILAFWVLSLDSVKCVISYCVVIAWRTFLLLSYCNLALLRYLSLSSLPLSLAASSYHSVCSACYCSRWARVCDPCLFVPVLLGLAWALITKYGLSCLIVWTSTFSLFVCQSVDT